MTPLTYKTISSWIPYFISFFFFILYSILSLVKHAHFLSGYDLAVIDQAIWKYSQFKLPISTNHAYPFTSVLTDHVELIFILIAPFYWIINNVYILILLQNAVVASSGIPMYLLMKKHDIKPFLSNALLISFFMFYGIQQAIWSDVHSLVFGVSSLAWFIYFAEQQTIKISFFFLILTIFSKEDMALLTFIISCILFIVKRKKVFLIFAAISLLYIFIIFFIYFPYFVEGGYRFQNQKGLLSHIEISNLFNTKEKKDVIFYSILWFGGLPVLAPFYMLPFLFDISKYFILGNDNVTSAHSIFMHYRSTLAVLLLWPTIYTIKKFTLLNRNITGIYVLILAITFQYFLHLPLSYLSKKWFWSSSPSITSINKMISLIPSNSSLVTQVNIAPHVSHRDEIFLLWPKQISKKDNSGCEEEICHWLYWPGRPMYMLIDTSPEWDSRHLLTNNQEFVKSIKNLEKAEKIHLYKALGTTKMYRITYK